MNLTSSCIIHGGGFIAIRHLLFFYDFRHGEMLKIARKNRHFAITFRHHGENCERFLAVFAILPLLFAMIAKCFAIMAKMFDILPSIFAIMAGMAKKIIAIFRHSYFFPKINGEMAMSPPSM